MTLYYPEDWIAMRDALLGWLAAGVGALPAIWKEQDAPGPQKPYAALRLLSSPVMAGSPGETNERGVDVQLVSPLELYSVTIDGAEYSYLSDSNPTETEIRDGLIAAVNLALPGTARAVTASALALTVAADVEISSADETLVAPKIFQHYIGQGVLVVEVDGYSNSRDELVEVIDGLRLDLDASGVREAFSIVGIAPLQILETRTLAFVVNGLWEYRCGFDLRLSVLTRRIEVIDLIESIADGGVALTLSV